MSIPDKIAAANKINDLLKGIVSNGGLRLKYRITVDPPLQENRDWERPEILVEFVGPDSPLLLERGGELLRSIEFLALEMLRLPGNEHEKVCFDCMNHRGMRLEELRLAAGVAADRVRKSGSSSTGTSCWKGIDQQHFAIDRDHFCMQPGDLGILQYDLTNCRFPSHADARSAEGELLAGARPVEDRELAEHPRGTGVAVGRRDDALGGRL